MSLSIVLDTNVFLVAFSRRSKYNWILQALLNEQYQLCLTTDIAFEYLEVVLRHGGRQAAHQVALFLERTEQVVWVHKYYAWRLIEADLDDNKFVDCAVAVNADYLVTEDQHFNVLQDIPFPTVRVLDIAGFQRVLEEYGTSSEHQL